MGGWVVSTTPRPSFRTQITNENMFSVSLEGLWQRTPEFSRPRWSTKHFVTLLYPIVSTAYKYLDLSTRNLNSWITCVLHKNLTLPIIGVSWNSFALLQSVFAHEKPSDVGGVAQFWHRSGPLIAYCVRVTPLTCASFALNSVTDERMDLGYEEMIRIYPWPL